MNDKPLRTRKSGIPYRLDLAGSWHDQPFVSRHADGVVVTLSILPNHRFDPRSGLASSTRKSAIDLWGNALPGGDPVKAGKILFRYDNPPGTKDISGSQDALGITLPGLNRLHYSGGDYWPVKIESHAKPETLSWLESRIKLVGLGPRSQGYNVLENARITPERAGSMAVASAACWEAILAHDMNALGQAMTKSFAAQSEMLPRVRNKEVDQAIASYAGRVAGYKLAGAGGGGYLIVVTEEDLPGSLEIEIVGK